MGGGGEILLDEVVGEQDDLCARSKGLGGSEVADLLDVELGAGHALEDVERVGEDGGVPEHLEVDELEDGSSFDIPVSGPCLYGGLFEGGLDYLVFAAFVVAQGFDEPGEGLREEGGLRVIPHAELAVGCVRMVSLSEPCLPLCCCSIIYQC